MEPMKAVPPPWTARWLLRRWRLILVATVALALGLALALVPWPEVGEAIGAARVSFLLAAVALNLAVFPFWVWQWQLIAAPLARVDWRTMSGVVALSVTAKVALSGVAGLSSGLLALRYRAGLSYSEAGTVISVDQFFALVTKVAVIGLALLLLPLPAVLLQAALGLAALSGLMLAVLWLAGPPGHRPLPVDHRLQLPFRAVRRFLNDLAALRSWPVLAGGLALALIKKALETGAALAVQLACGIEASPAAAVLVVAAVSLTTLVPVAPANLGIHSAGVFAAYALLDTPTDQAIAAGLLHHAMLLVASVLAALSGLWLARR